MPKQRVTVPLAMTVTMLVAVAALACGTPSRREPSTRAAKSDRTVLLTTEADDRRVGEEAAEQIEAEMGLVSDERLQRYVAGIGRRLVPHTTARRFEYRFAIVDQMEPNAFALPGGYIYVSRGLLALVNSEDELACVLGHEITHASARHAAARQAVMRHQNPFALPFLRMGDIASYGRDQERDADRGGQELAAAVGYDPAGMADFLSSLGNVERMAVGYSRLPSFFATHPGTTERVATNANRAQQLEWTPNPDFGHGPADYVRHVEGIVLEENPAEGVFDETLFLHPDMNFSLRFPEGWEVTNSPRAVGATAPRGEAVVFLEADGDELNPERAADAFVSDNQDQYRLEVHKAQHMKVGHIDAYRLELESATPAGSVTAIITFIPYNGLMFRITGAAPGIAAKKYLGRIRNTARSFRPLTRNQRNSVEVLRLRVVRALPGETLLTLGERTENEWNAQRTAVLNGVFSDVIFAGGERVKIAKAELYEVEDEPRGGGEETTHSETRR